MEYPYDFLRLHLNLYLRLNSSPYLTFSLSRFLIQDPRYVEYPNGFNSNGT